MDSVDYRLQLMLEAQDNASKIIDDLTKKVEELKKEVDNNTTSVKQAESQAIGAVKSIKSVLKTLGLTALFAMATNEISKGIQALADYESAIKRLEILTRNSSGATQGQVNTLVAQAEALDKVWVATKDSIIAAQSQLATFDLSTKAIETLTPAITDYVIAEKGASATAEDFRSMTNGLAQALDWNYASLTRTWFILDEDTKKIIETGDEMEKAAAIVKVLESTYKWFNEEIARSTLEGQMIMTEKAFNNLRDTIAWALTPAIQEVYWKIEEVFNKATDRVNNHIEEIRSVADTVADVVTTIIDTATYLIDTAWDLINELSGRISDLLRTTEKDSSDSMTAIKGNFSDLVYYFEQGINVISWLVKMVVAAFKSWFSTIGNYIKAVAQTWVHTFESMVNAAIDWINWLSEAVGAGSLMEKVTLSANSYADIRGEALADTTDAATESRNDIKAAWDKMGTDMVNSYSERVAQIRKENTTFKQFDKLEDTTTKPKGPGGSGSWSWKKAKDDTADRVKAMNKLIEEQKKARQQYYKSLDSYANEQLNKQKKVIDDLNKEYQDKFDEIQDKIDDTSKSIKGLNDSISDLKTQLANLKVDENKSIAQEVIRARKEIAALEDEYEGLKETANSVSRNDLQGLWGVGKYDVDLIKKYKDYQDELASMYDGMSASEKQALDKEIEYAQWYDSLNWIQKIKEDYRIRQEEIQAELDSKIASLNSEQELLRQYKKEQKKLQEERIKKIDEEYKKYEDLYKKVEDFEKQYMSQLETDHRKQVSMTDKLVDQWNAVYKAKMRAMEYSGADGSRASWGPVYSGQSYLVWENGPEMFVPSTNWKIIKNSDLNNWGPVNVNINISDVTLNNWIDVKALAEQIEQEITRSVVLNKKGIYSM